MTTNSQYQEALSKVLARAEGDPAFRAVALSDATAAVKEATGLDVPAGLTVRFVEAGEAGSFSGPNYVIPLLWSAEDELTDSEMLDHVAGGMRSRGNPYYTPPESSESD